MRSRIIILAAALVLVCAGTAAAAGQYVHITVDQAYLADDGTDERAPRPFRGCRGPGGIPELGLS